MYKRQFGPIDGKKYGGGFLGIWVGGGVSKKPVPSVEYTGDHLLGDALEAVWGIDILLQEARQFPECMSMIMRACGVKYDKEAVRNYVVKMNKAVNEWSDRHFHDWTLVDEDIASHWGTKNSGKNFGRLAAAFFDMKAKATAPDMTWSSSSWSPQSQSAAHEHASHEKKGQRIDDAERRCIEQRRCRNSAATKRCNRARDAGRQIDDDTFRRKRKRIR